jgi:formylmethanofuran dehydrogenase subunit E
MNDGICDHCGEYTEQLYETYDTYVNQFIMLCQECYEEKQDETN